MGPLDVANALKSALVKKFPSGHVLDNSVDEGLEWYYLFADTKFVVKSKNDVL